MSRKYNNYTKKLENYGVSIVTSIEEYINSCKTTKYPSMTLKCPNNHVFDMKVTSLSNKFSKLEKDPTFSLCSECDKPEISMEELNAKEFCEKLGFEFINYSGSKTRTITYKCVCGNVSSTNVRNIRRENRQAQCLKCQNNKHKNSVEDVKKTFSENGCELLSEYINRQTPVKYKCVCGTISHIRYADFMVGKRCNAVCKARKYKDTCVSKYGVENVSQLDSVKEKSKKTRTEKNRK